MKSKKNGFTYIECIVSISILITAVSLIYTSLYGSFNITVRNSDYNEILSIVKDVLEDTKYVVSNSSEDTISDYYDVIERKDYTVHTKLGKVKNYYQCYKIDVWVNHKNTSIELSSYVTAQ